MSILPPLLKTSNKAKKEYIWKSKRPRITKTLTKKNEDEVFALPDIHNFLKVVVIMIMWFGPRSRQIDQWKKIESP